jgi:D-glycero-alpha-D-manno-heptose 1-phosphate guanylyltransferase
MKDGLSDLDVIVLCGGKGTRLRGVVDDRPKPMVEVNGRPFLDILLDYFASFGLKRFILSAGYMGEFIERYYAQKAALYEVIVVKEQQALGTAGAVKFAESLIKSDPFIVTNGDSLCKADLKTFCEFHEAKRGDVSLVVNPANGRTDAGSIALDDGGKVIAFQEKGAHGEYLSAGIYMLKKAVLTPIPTGGSSSLEYDVFPSLAAAGSVFGLVTNEQCYDIGTPERLEQFLRNNIRICNG